MKNGGENMRNKVIGALFLSLAASIWGAMYVVVKVVVDVVPPLELVWIRYVIAVIVLAIIGLCMKQSWRIAKKRLVAYFSCRSHWKHNIDCHTRNWHDAINCSNGCHYYSNNPCFYGSICTLYFKRKNNVKKNVCLSC